MPKSQLASDLLKTANELVAAANNKPRQSNLRRATSTTYYALFHCLSNNCANVIVGKGKNHGREAWRQAYRALNHGFAKAACDGSKNKTILERFPNEIQDFANTFYGLQIKRHKADYDPYVKFKKSSVITDIKSAEAAISAFEGAPHSDRRAFAALVLFQKRPH